MEWLQDILANPIARGALEGIGGALVIDYVAFRSWKRLDDALSYDWRTAGWRWLQGAVGGAVAAAGLGTVIG